MTTNERPGVYTSYIVTASRYSGVSRGIAGIAAAASDGDSGTVYTVTDEETAAELFGADSNITALIGILLKNRVAEIKAVPVLNAQTASYTAAFGLLAADESIKAIVCDSSNAAVAAALKQAILNADVRAEHKIGIVESSGTTADYVAAAEALNCERMVMAAPSALDENGEDAVCGTLAAAVCGALLRETDPALPLNGAVLYGVGGVTKKFTDGDINTLVRGGVTPVELTGGNTCVVRGITTKSKNGSVPDSTWRELTTVMIVDDVIPTVRDALRNSFARTKNTAQTRGAIRTRVIVELEKKMTAEVIESYGNVTVTADENDPTVCNVSFDFTVVHGLNQICLTAYITV